ncbi:MAG: cupin domain-containing protein [Lachnospiraceae bacterium]|nr:cupin domain-containing protein [Lachnospiraceae bacterium]
MFTLHEKDKEFRHKDHGPKYLEEGPRMKFGIVQILPHSEVSPHVHKQMQEGFYILEGCPTFHVGDQNYTAVKGDYVHIESGEGHKISNDGDVKVRMIVTAAPYVKDDKEPIDM